MKHYLTIYVNGAKQNTILMNSLPSFQSGSIKIGRAETNDIILPYPFVSRNHAVIEFRSNGVEIADCGSLNKLRINKTPYERIRLHSGMNVDIGNADNIVTLSYNTVEEAPAFAAQDFKGETAQYGSARRRRAEQEPSAAAMTPGFGQRLFAALTDFTICMFMMIGTAIIILFLLNSVISSVKIIAVLTLLISLFVVWLYFALGESGESKGTMGKIALGLWVVDKDTDEQISFGKASRRYFAKLLSILILFIGFFPIFGKKQTLHDYVAGTRVVKNPRLKS